MGVAATTAINMATYADMLVRGRPASRVPADSVRSLADRAGVALGSEGRAASRTEAAGALMGYVTGIGLASGYVLAEPLVRGRRPVWLVGSVLGAVAMVGGNAPAIASGSTDPRHWGLEGWLADIVPHLVYGVVAVATADAIGGRE